jgi:DHA2 family methylenomycin A resistance protein-like MFS transporter
LVFVLSLFFQGVQGYSPVQTGLAFLPMTAVLTIGNIIAGRLMAVRGTRTLMIAGQALATVGYLSMLRVGAGSSHIEIAIPMLLAGSGIALTVPPMTNASLSVVGPAKAGIASGVLNSARQVGGVLGVSLFGSLVRSTSEAAFMARMRTSLLFATGSLLAGSLASMVWVTRPALKPVVPVAITQPLE